MSGRLVVLGSVNSDLTVRVARHPLPGETLLGGDLSTGLGGKGANQAAAAARMGVAPLFLGAVGTDAVGDTLRSGLAAAGVDVSALATVDGPSGVALITVADDGENTIVVAAGANDRVDAATVRDTVSALDADDVVLAQLEVPLDVVSTASSSTSARFVLNLSPARDVPAPLLAACDPLIVNETEAALIAGDGSPEELVQRLRPRVRSVVLTLGGDGALVADGEGMRHHPAPQVEVVDTTGAGDAFAGALAAALARGAALNDAAAAGVAAGAEAVQWVGAQPR